MLSVTSKEMMMKEEEPKCGVNSSADLVNDSKKWFKLIKIRKEEKNECLMAG